MAGKNRAPCCESSTFPYSEETFNECLLLAVKDLYQTPSRFFVPGVAGPRFSKTTFKMQALVVEYESNTSYSLSYTEMRRFYVEVETWMQKQLATAPDTINKGWFTSDLAFYDVQHALSQSTSGSIGLAMVIALIVLLLATGNVWLSVVSTLCLSAVVVVSIACLVLLGWKLNVLESVSVTVAVGLSVDYTLHYAVGYRLGLGSLADSSRRDAVFYSLQRMSSPIAMAAVTTLAGNYIFISIFIYIFFVEYIWDISADFGNWFLGLINRRLWQPAPPSCRPASSLTSRSARSSSSSC